jgi:CheY-like chemotaxis protein
MMSALLPREGFVVDCASNGREAFEYLRRGSYSVIFLDLVMPEINGMELLERLERDSPMLMRRVIVMTGAPNRLSERTDAGTVWGVIRKPFDMPELIRSAKICASGRPRIERRREPRPEPRLFS